MRKILFLIMVLMAGSTTLYSQHVIISTGSEWTVGGFEAVVMSGYQTSGKWCYGLFYQKTFRSTVDATANKDVISGGYVQVPIVRCEKIDFLLTQRIGFINRNYLIYIPGLETRLRLSNRLSFSTGLAIRKTYPSLSGKITIEIF
jgi:hypothetical protein